MAIKTYKISPEVEEAAKGGGFPSVNQYVKHLMQFHREAQQEQEDTMVKIFNRTIAFLELERMTMHRTAEALHLLLKKTDIDLQLTEQEREYLRFAIDDSLKRGAWGPK
ncbi:MULTISPECIES: hypothetical protein [Burkholderia]|uniref:hypothetical protein n=1 Tax=Burkholderia TaxID=32008 RepID=UPI00054FC17F|nr:MULTISPECIES: hypothetical protein [Burkholderia]TCT26554.1 hypothetical protein EC918_12217 [Burkholderia vietnamiensis]SCZ46703.1 hypothetical protein SAMN02787148_13617 [Burkholderia vietnamiensis]SFY39877.1 hypothetical protein SAMN02787160_1366 [Burkholderia vietnamiensis]